MSNRRKIHPTRPAELVRFARSYRCMDCSGGDCHVVRLGGMWTVVIGHDDGCPALTGTVSRLGAAREAARAARLAGSAPYAQLDI